MKIAKLLPAAALLAAVALTAIRSPGPGWSTPPPGSRSEMRSESVPLRATPRSPLTSRRLSTVTSVAPDALRMSTPSTTEPS
ncbi:MAG TPA: hypothetical protein VFX98_05995, partial [Longimicrobiaceae bacterium]|nr:hypothetical protein [Longimicrobiaceae bacterium]